MANFLLKERVLLYSSEFCLRELFNYNNCEKVKCDNNSRVKLLEDCLFFLNKNWNQKYNYPIYVHHFDDIYTESFKKKN